MQVPRAAQLVDLPTEILLEICSLMDVVTLLDFTSTNKALSRLLRDRKSTILLPILQREFSPLDELFQIYTASVEDIASPLVQYQPRHIVFKRFPGDRGCVVGTANSAMPEFSAYTHVSNPKFPKGRATQHMSRVSPRNVVLTERDLDPILKLCLLTRKWERLFPQMRWLHEPENCRSLRPHEMVRFRRAFYRWWIYGLYFHGEWARPRVGLPMPWVDDIRTSQMRQYSSTDLYDLMDLLETIKDVILHYICPRLDPDNGDSTDLLDLVEQTDRGLSLARSWTDQSRWGRIIKTYAKLGPEELMHYFDNIYSYSRKRLITEIRLQRPGFTFDQESIQVALRCVVSERQEGWDRPPPVAENGVGGIVDFDDYRDQDRVGFGRDGSWDGTVSPGSRSTAINSRYSPRGDDGSLLEDMYYAPSFNFRSGTTVLRA